MPGQERDGILAAFIDDDHGRVRRLGLHVRRDRPHRNARRPDEHETAGIAEVLLRPRRQRAIARTAADRAVVRCLRIAQMRGYSFRQRFSGVGEGQECEFHLVASRYPVVKDGSYSLLRSYFVPRNPPTMISAVRVMFSFFAVSASVPTVQWTLFSSGQVAL